MSLEIYCRTRLTKINFKDEWYSVGKITFFIKLVLFLSAALEFVNVWTLDLILKIPLVSPAQI